MLRRYGIDTNSETPRSAHSLIVVDMFVKSIFKIGPGVDTNYVHVTIDFEEGRQETSPCTSSHRGGYVREYIF